MHVIIDGYGGDPDQLADENVVRAILDRYPQEMGMTKIAPPMVVRYKGSKPEDWGVSGYVMIAESHYSDVAQSYARHNDCQVQPLGQVSGSGGGCGRPFPATARSFRATRRC